MRTELIDEFVPAPDEVVPKYRAITSPAITAPPLGAPGLRGKSVRQTVGALLQHTAFGTHALFTRNNLR